MNDGSASRAATIRLMTSADVDSVKTLFRDYEQWLDAKQCFADFNREMADLTAAFAAILVAEADGALVGVVALKDSGERTAEMKRLYCRPDRQGRGVGERLVRAAIEVARDKGFRSVMLVTLPRLTAAIGLYRKLGFVTDTSSSAEIGMSLALGPERRLA
ncbi:MAG: GNAT family N-acetyltransferase [Rhodospirillaceae bacterium]|nr:GNAT family N-acetyltransferase [Rhodospirillaceae bacterium]